MAGVAVGWGLKDLAAALMAGLILLIDEPFQVGDRITTSGNGGMFPPGLPVGMVESVRDGVVRVQLFEDLTRLEYVRIVDFSGFIADSTMRTAPLPPR